MMPRFLTFPTETTPDSALPPATDANVFDGISDEGDGF